MAKVYHIIMSFEIVPLLTARVMSELRSICLFPPSDHRFATEAFGERFYENFKWSDGRVEAAVSLPVIMWYIGGGAEKIIVDTSFEEKPYPDLQDGPKLESSISDLLKKIGVSPDEIKTVINTHLHSDHFGNNELFTNANFVVQKDEMDVALSPEPWMPFYFESQSRHIRSVIGKTRVVDGDAKIMPGISVIKLGGHTPGSQAVIVEGEGKRVAIAGDVVPTYFNIDHMWPTGNYWNLMDVLKAMKELKDQCDEVLPSHDWKIFEKYPEGVIRV